MHTIIPATTDYSSFVRVIEQIPVSILVTDKDGTIEYVNNQFTQVTGYTLDELKGKNPRILKSGYTPSESYRKLWETITSGNVWKGEFINRRKNGEIYSEWVHVFPLKNAENVITHYIAVKSDITEIKRLEKEQAEFKVKLANFQKIESIGRLAGGVAHDFNNFLMAIIGYANLIQMELGENTPVSRFLQNILTVSEKASNLAKKLLTFSKQQSVTLIPVNLNGIIEEMGDLLKSSIGRDIIYKQVLSHDDCIIKGDEGQIEQILLNLILNARDSMPDGGCLTVSTRIEKITHIVSLKFRTLTTGKYAILSVSDTGHGMDNATKEKIFDPFFTTKERGQGTGLGLSVVYGIIMKHNAFVDVISEVGKGTKFEIYFPLLESFTKNNEKEKEINAPSTVAAEKDVKTILLADDQPDVRDVLRKMLEKKGFKVIVAEDGAEAIEKFELYGDSIDLLLFDMRMPKKNGKEAYEIIKEKRHDIKVIFLSGYSSTSISDEIEYQNLPFISKPVCLDNLLRKMRDLLELENDEYGL